MDHTLLSYYFLKVMKSMALYDDHQFQILPRIDSFLDKLILHDGDLTDGSALTRIVSDVKPDEIYNLAAQSDVHVSFDSSEYTGDVDALGVLRILEAVRINHLEKKQRYTRHPHQSFSGR